MKKHIMIGRSSQYYIDLAVKVATSPNMSDSAKLDFLKMLDRKRCVQFWAKLLSLTALEALLFWDIAVKIGNRTHTDHEHSGYPKDY